MSSIGALRPECTITEGCLCAHGHQVVCPCETNPAKVCRFCGTAADHSQQRHKFEALPTPAFIPWPSDQPPRYNACTDPCDMWTGPCACGAWHHDGR